MTPENTDAELSSALKRLHDEFRPNELAYLAATSKSEGPIRDRLAFELHRAFEKLEVVVAREWNRVDLAILDRAGDPICLVEAKAMYTFDAFRGLAERLSWSIADEEKARRHAGPKTAVYSLLLATHPHGQIATAHMKTVKYAADVNKAVKAQGGDLQVRQKASALVGAAMEGRKRIADGTIDGGRAFGVDFSVLYWLVRDQGPPRSVAATAVI